MKAKSKNKPSPEDELTRLRTRIAELETVETEHKQTVKALRESEEKHRLLFENATDIIWTTDKNLNFTYQSPSVERIRGYTPEEAVAQSTEESVTPDSLNVVMTVFTEEMELVQQGDYPKNRTRTFNAELTCKSGSTIWAEVAARFLFDNQKNHVGVLGISRDITERMQAEEKLQEELNLNTMLLDSLPHPAMIITSDRKVIALNRIAREAGVAIDTFCWEEFGKCMFIPEENLAEYKSSGKVPLGTICSFCRADNCLENQNEQNDPEVNAFEKIWDTYWIAINEDMFLHYAIDITDRKEAEAKAYRLKALEEIERLRSSLIASVSHELRTPLAAIKGMSDTLVQTDVEWDSETQMDYLINIVQEVDSLTHMVSDLVELSQLEAGMMKMEKEPSTLSALGVHLKNQLRELTVDHELFVNIPTSLPPIEVDETRIGEVVINLISNAVAYSIKGSRITIEGKCIHGEVVLSIADEGIGIPAEQLTLIFERFYRVESGVHRRRGGIGLGLSICKRVIEQHEGRIWVESEVGKGSTFSFSLPITTAYTQVD
ncbi:MAG: PAS domain S-box protein [Planctomycetes bacterium]|nr:PAS domain S-box protein [Planctomycetota bacterium]